MSYLRHPRTTGELRAAVGSPVNVRPKRVWRLPSNWDDKPVAARRDRTWKRYRDKQWR